MTTVNVGNGHTFRIYSLVKIAFDLKKIAT